MALQNLFTNLIKPFRLKPSFRENKNHKKGTWSLLELHWLVIVCTHLEIIRKDQLATSEIVKDVSEEDTIPVNEDSSL